MAAPYTNSQTGVNNCIGHLGISNNSTGLRDVLYTMTGGTTGNNARVHMLNSIMNLAEDPTITGTFVLSYGDYTSSGLAGKLDADFTGDTALHFAIVFADQGGTVNISIGTNEGAFNTSVAQAITLTAVPED